MNQRLFLKKHANGWWETSLEMPEDAKSEGPASDDRPTRLSLFDILELVAHYYKVRAAELTGTRRHQAAMRPRHVSMYLCRKYLDESYPALGRQFQRDHSTIINAVKGIEELRNSDASLRSDLEKLEVEITKETA